MTGRSLRAGEEAAFCLAQESLVLSGVKGGGWKLTASSGCTLIGERVMESEDQINQRNLSPKNQDPEFRSEP